MAHLIRAITRGEAKFFVDPETFDKVPGVTSVLDMLPKPFLKSWAAKEVAKAAVDEVDVVKAMSAKDPDAAIDHLKGAPYRATRHAAQVGVKVHSLFEDAVLGREIGEVDEETQPYLNHINEFLEVCQPKVIAVEQTIWSETHKYAGRFDALMEIFGEKVWIDFKTTKSGIHEEVGLQLAAYRYADRMVDERGNNLEIPETTGGAVLHVRPEGWNLTAVRCDPQVFEVFLHLREVFRYERELKPTVISTVPVAKGNGQGDVVLPEEES